MKKTLLIASLGLITTLGYSQTTPTGNSAPKPQENALKPIVEKKTEVASPSDKKAKQNKKKVKASVPMAEQLKKSKAISMQLIQSLSKSESTLISKNVLNDAMKMITESNEIGNLFNAFRIVMKATPDQAYKSSNAQEGRIMTNEFTPDVDYAAFNGIIMKWEMLLKPECFDAAWKTNEVKWKKDIQATSKK
jgi:gas vesicle protein